VTACAAPLTHADACKTGAWGNEVAIEQSCDPASQLVTKATTIRDFLEVFAGTLV
jgi:hypothetical protein